MPQPFSTWCLTLLTSLALLAARPACGQKQADIKVVGYALDGAGPRLMPNDTTVKAANYFSYRITLTGYPLLAAAQATINVAGPRFDASEAACWLLLEQRRLARRATGKDRQAILKDTVRKALLLSRLRRPASSRPRPGRRRKPTNEQQQQAYLHLLGQQLTTGYAAIVLPGAAGQPVAAADADADAGLVRAATRRDRDSYTIRSPEDCPRFLRPGTVVKFPFRQLNWLKYAPVVTSQGRVREYAQATLPILVPAEETHSITPKVKEVAEGRNLRTLTDMVQAYDLLVDALEALYTADHWTRLPTSRTACKELARQALGTEAISAWGFANAPQWYEEQAALLKPGSNSALAGDSLLRLRVHIESELGAARQARLATLARVLAVVLAPAPVRVPTQVPLPDDADEADVVIDYKLRADYQQPASGPATQLAKEEFTILLLPRFRITASVGLYASGLVDHSFVFVNDSVVVGRSKAAAPDTTTRRLYSPRKRIERDNGGEWYSLVGAAAFGHFEYRLSPMLGVGLTLGVGVQSGGPRLLLGPTVLLGNDQRLILSGGLAAGRVVRLATGYGEGHAFAIKDPGTSLVPTRTINAVSGYVSLSYNLRSTKK